MDVAILGAGAAGCFCGVLLSRWRPDVRVELFEAGPRPLAKVAITGGGRCNLTNSFRLVERPRDVYPRGEQLMRRILRVWGHEETMDWFEREGVRLVTQEDECVFPQSQDAREIVETLLRGLRRGGVAMHLSHRATDIEPLPDGFRLTFADERQAPRRFDAVVCATGGLPRLEQYRLFRHLGVEVVPPVPSLFTFRIDNDELTALMGTVVEHATLSLAGTKLRASGALLITHWGVSGPATLRLSSYAARHLAETGHVAELCINWLGDADEAQATALLADLVRTGGGRQMCHLYPPALSAKLWAHLLRRCGIAPEQRWSDLAGRPMRRLCATLTADTYHIGGRGQWRDEFVTAGGIALRSIDMQTMALKAHPRFFVAGEVLDVDGVTGGFNLQAAWSMGYVAAKSLAAIGDAG